MRKVKVFAGCWIYVDYFSQCVDSLWGSSGACMLVSWWVMDTGTGGRGVMIHISVSATGIWVWDCPLVVGAGLVPFSGGDSPLTVGLSVGSWGSGATDTRVLAWFSSSTWKDSAWGEHKVKYDMQTMKKMVIENGFVFVGVKNKQMCYLLIEFMGFSFVNTGC